MDREEGIRSRVFSRKENIVQREIADEFILVPVSGELADLQRIFMLNPVAEHIWRRLDGARPVSAVIEAVSGAFDVGPEQAAADALAFIRELMDAGLIAETAHPVDGKP